MEDDDEFGDLYTDVLRPLTTSFQSHPGATDASMSSQSRPIDRDINSYDEEIHYGVSDLKNQFSNSNPVPGLKLNASIQGKTLNEKRARPERGGVDFITDSNLGDTRIVGGDVLDFEVKGWEKDEDEKLPEKGAVGLNLMEEDNDLNILVEKRDDKDDDFVEKGINFIEKQENVYSAAERNENMDDFIGAGAVGETDTEQMIPGLSGKLENQGDANFEDDCESEESDDDLRIVLNDNHEQMEMERMPEIDDEDDEEGEPLVIVVDNGDLGHRHQLQPMMMEDQEWRGEEGGPVADAERKELDDAAKASGGGGSTAPAAAQPKIGYSNHMYHHPFHSQFKYVRPGAAPLPGAAPVSPGGTQGQARPPIMMGAVAGRGRGDWRPAGVKGAVHVLKGLHPGQGMPVWGANTAGRGYGTGLDFTLPSHKTIFEVEIDGFEEKPWRLPGIDVSDFFNFGLNEESWKEYCKKLEQLRLETTMQSKIRVHESGRAEQDYDPELPPELAAAAGIQDIPSENVIPGKADTGSIDLATGGACWRPPLPVGRPIPVETGFGERLPSIDTRRPRMNDLNAIIVVVCQSSSDDDDMAKQQDNDPAEEDVTDDLQQDDTEHIHHFTHAYNGQKRELVSKREKLKKTVKTGGDDDLHAVSGSPVGYHPDGEIDLPHEDRSAKGSGHVKVSKMSASDNSGEKQIIDDQNESFDNENDKPNPHLLSSCAIGSDGEQAIAVVDDVNDLSVIDGRSSDLEREDRGLDATSSDALEDGKLMHFTTKQKRISNVEQLSQENDDVEHSHADRSSETSKAGSGSSKDHRKFHNTVEDEVPQDMHHPRGSNWKRLEGDEDNSDRRSQQGRDETWKHMAVKEIEDSHSLRGGDPYSSLHRQMKSESTEWRKESDITEGSWHRKDEDLHGRRTRVEDTRKREHGGEISSRNRGKARESRRGERDEHHQSRNQLDSGSLRGLNHDQDTGSRYRDRDDNIKTLNGKADDLQNRKRKVAHINREYVEKEEITYNDREGSNRKKRERDDSSNQRKPDEYAKLKDDMRYVREKEEGLLRKERGERQRDHDGWHKHKQSHDGILPRREREETRLVMRSARSVEDKTWTSHSRGNDGYKGSGREYHSKDVMQHSDLLKRREQAENESSSRHIGHEDVYARGNQGGNDEKRARYERLGTSDKRFAYASGTSRSHERRQKDGSRKSKESESGDLSSLFSSKRKHNEHSSQISEMVCMDPMP